MIRDVELSARAINQIDRVPLHIAEKLRLWVRTVRLIGLEETRKVPGFHDEPLRGQRSGQRSIRLNRSYRAIYTIGTRGNIEIAIVEEVNKHDY